MNAKAVYVAAALLVVAAAAAVAPAAATGGPTGSCGFPVTEVDATGTEVTVEDEPRQVVTLAPSAAQTMWEIGAKEKVVGVSKYASYLEGAPDRTNVSGAEQIVVVEKVVSLEPDLVLAPNVVPNATVEKLRDAGLTVFRFEMAGSIEDVYAKTRLTGRLVGECEGATATVDRMRDRIGTVREAVSGEERPGVLYVFFGYTASSGTFISEIIETAGGDNVAVDAGVPPGYHQLSQEVVANRSDDIEWIVLNSDDPRVPKSPAYNATTAVKEGNTVVLDANYISQPAPRIVRPITKLAKALHPDAYAAANATATPSPAPTPSPTPASTSPTPTVGDRTPTAGAGTTTPGQPGFGIVAVLAALAATLAARVAR